MGKYIPKTDGFKHYTYGGYKVDFYHNTAIVKWSRHVDDDFDEICSYKSHKKAISDTLKQSTVFDAKFIVLTDIWPHSYSEMPVEKEDVEIYLQFKQDLSTKDKRAEIKRFLDCI